MIDPVMPARWKRSKFLLRSNLTAPQRLEIKGLSFKPAVGGSVELLGAWGEAMPISLARKSILAAVAVGILVILIVAVLPLVASTQIVRDRIAYQMSVWSGYRVRLDSTPEIRVWPAFQAVLHDVTFLDWNAEEPHTLLDAERVDLDLSALAALSGNVVFTRMHLIRPVLRLQQEGGKLRIPAPQDWGRLARSVSAARQIVSAAPAAPDTDALPSYSFGVVKVTDGRIVAAEGEEQSDVVTSVSGTLDWPSLNRKASLSATGIWHGESISLTASSAQPLILFGGGNASVELSLQSTPAALSFAGAANLANTNFVDGQLSVSAPSVSRLLEWMHVRSLVAGRLGALSLEARVVGDTNRLKLEQAALNLNSSAGKGLLDIGFGNGRPTIAGTLAFDTLDLQTLSSAFNPISPALKRVDGAGLNGTGLDFDLRFSVANATYGGAAFSNVAAAAKMRDGLATFDISDATAFDGQIQFGVRADRTGAEELVEISMMGEDIDASGLATALGHQALIPQGRGTFSLMLRGKGQDFETVLQNADGSLSATLGKGSIPGVTLEAFLERSAEGDFFPLADLGGSSLPIDGAELKASVIKGVVQIDKAEAQSGQHRISIDGLVPLAGRGLALYGTLSAPQDADPRFTSPLTFFVGGSWSAPFVASFQTRMPN